MEKFEGGRVQLVGVDIYAGIKNETQVIIKIGNIITRAKSFVTFVNPYLSSCIAVSEAMLNSTTLRVIEAQK